MAPTDLFDPPETGPKIRAKARLSKYPEVPKNKAAEDEINGKINDHEARLLALESRAAEGPPISPEDLALKLTELEAGEREVDIAQMKEVVRVMPEAFKSYTDSQIIRFLRGMK